jgi:hypothetical protein
MSCPVCRDKRLVEIHVTLKGSRVTMHSCSHCETRWWDTDGQQVPLKGVFQLAAPQK